MLTTLKPCFQTVNRSLWFFSPSCSQAAASAPASNDDEHAEEAALSAPTHDDATLKAVCDASKAKITSELAPGYVAHETTP